MDVILGSLGAAVVLVGFILLIVNRVRFLLHLTPKRRTRPIVVMVMGAILVAIAWAISPETDLLF